MSTATIGDRAAMLDRLLRDQPTAISVATAQLGAWHWLGLTPSVVRIVGVTTFGDLFVRKDTDEVLFVDVVRGLIGDAGGDDVELLVDDPVPTVDLFRDQLLAAMPTTTTLAPGQCLRFKQAPARGGSFDVDNVEVGLLAEHLGLMGQLHARAARRAR